MEQPPITSPGFDPESILSPEDNPLPPELPGEEENESPPSTDEIPQNTFETDEESSEGEIQETIDLSSGPPRRGMPPAEEFQQSEEEREDRISRTVAKNLFKSNRIDTVNLFGSEGDGTPALEEYLLPEYFSDQPLHLDPGVLATWEQKRILYLWCPEPALLDRYGHQLMKNKMSPSTQLKALDFNGANRSRKFISLETIKDEKGVGKNEKGTTIVRVFLTSSEFYSSLFRDAGVINALIRQLETRKMFLLITAAQSSFDPRLSTGQPGFHLPALYPDFLQELLTPYFDEKEAARLREQILIQRKDKHWGNSCTDSELYEFVHSYLSHSPSYLRQQVELRKTPGYSTALEEDKLLRTSTARNQSLEFCMMAAAFFPEISPRAFSTLVGTWITRYEEKKQFPNQEKKLSAHWLENEDRLIEKAGLTLEPVDADNYAYTFKDVQWKTGGKTFFLRNRWARVGEIIQYTAESGLLLGTDSSQTLIARFASLCYSWFEVSASDSAEALIEKVFSLLAHSCFEAPANSMEKIKNMREGTVDSQHAKEISDRVHEASVWLASLAKSVKLRPRLEKVLEKLTASAPGFLFLVFRTRLREADPFELEILLRWMKVIIDQQMDRAEAKAFLIELLEIVLSRPVAGGKILNILNEWSHQGQPSGRGASFTVQMGLLSGYLLLIKTWSEEYEDNNAPAGMPTLFLPENNTTRTAAGALLVNARLTEMFSLEDEASLLDRSQFNFFKKRSVVSNFLKWITILFPLDYRHEACPAIREVVQAAFASANPQVQKDIKTELKKEMQKTVNNLQLAQSRRHGSRVKKLANQLKYHRELGRILYAI